MRKILFIAGLLLTTAINAQVLRPFTVRYNNVSVRGNIVYVANNTITSPSQINTENPPGGTALNDVSLAAHIDVDPLVTVIPWNSTWKFCDSGYAPGGINWRNAAYNDAGWSSATANTPASPLRDIGYGDGDEVAPYVFANCGVRPGIPLPVCAGKYWTTYFRQKINVASVAYYNGFRINLHRDDGAVVYVNGVEVFRSNMPAGVINYNTAASAGQEGATEDVTVNIGTAAFVNGINQVAVEVHQRVITNSADGNDMSFRMELLGDPTFSSFIAGMFADFICRLILGRFTKRPGWRIRCSLDHRRNKCKIKNPRRSFVYNCCLNSNRLS
jgi:hypothetical protein